MVSCNRRRFARSKLRAFIFRIGGVDGAGGASTLMATIDLEVPVRSVAVGLSGGDVIDVDVGGGPVRRSRHEHLAFRGVVCSRL